jgi:1-acyl-sn-glycerol-3-phosphate acyltransferase
MIFTFLLIVWIIIDTFVMSLTAITVSFFSRTGNSVHLIARSWAKSILWASRIKIHVQGLSNLDPDKPFVYMCNHQSNFDIPVLYAALPIQFRWLAKKELFRIPIFGRAMRGAGYVSIDRFNRQSAINSISKAAERIRNGVSVMIFPEGTRSPDGKIGKFKKGGFFLSLDAGVPIVPVVINGTWPIMSKGSLLINPGEVNVSIIPPINIPLYSEENKDELIDKVRNIIINTFEGSEADRGI